MFANGGDQYIQDEHWTVEETARKIDAKEKNESS